jgi:hypothetical protein
VAFLEQFSDEEKNMIVSLPYRAGIWIGSVDETGSTVSDLHERVSLRDTIEKKASGLFESAFVHEVMVELKRRDVEWDKWQGQVGDILADCKSAVKIVETKMTEHDTNAYKRNMMQIATSVALAFREFDEKAGFFKKLGVYTRIGIDKILGGIKGESYSSEQLLNISLAEDLALAKLAKALDFNQNIVFPEKAEK